MSGSVDRRKAARDSRRRRRLGHARLAVVVAALAAVGILVGRQLSGSHSTAPTLSAHLGAGQTSAPNTGPSSPRLANASQSPVVLAERPLGSLGAPVQNAAVAATSSTEVAVLGGLTASDTSRGDIFVVTGGKGSGRGRLPRAVHDSAAAALGGNVYLFGGGNGTAQLDQIIRVDPTTGASRTVGRLPAPSSDQASAAVGGTAYVVGGYTGARWLDTIVAWRPGSSPRLVGRLPRALRYPAVAAAAGRIVIAGGSTPSGGASNAILSFDPATGRVTRMGHLPLPTTHAAAAAIGDTIYIIGGRGATTGTARDRIVSVNVQTGRSQSAGRLGSARSDLAAVGLSGRILLVGGRQASGTVGTLSELVPESRPADKPTTGNQTVNPSPAGPGSNVYAADSPGNFSPATHGALKRIYVPNSESGTVDVIDPRTFRVVGHFQVGGRPQHVVPSWDLKTLYVNNNDGNSLTPVNPRTAHPGPAIPVDDPYNLYFTPDGRFAIVVAERNDRLDFRDRTTLKLTHSLALPCKGINHMDFSADNRYLIASCEFSGELVKVDVERQRVVGTLALAGGSMPQDVKLSPDGRVFYIADMQAGGVWKVDGEHLNVTGFLATGKGAHGLYPSRDAKFLYVSNRGAGTVSVVSFATQAIVQTWQIPGGSPDMGGVSADGRVLWLTGRYNQEVYAIDTRTGRLRARIKVGKGPHGLSVWPQPGRYSLGHTGILR